MTTVAIQRIDGSTEDMEIDEFTRWMCLVEALHFIEEKAKDLNIDVENMIKPLAIEEYIKERFLSMQHDVKVEVELGIL